MPDIASLTQFHLNFILIIKIGFLFAVSIHAIFMLLVLAKTRTLTRVISIQSGGGKVFLRVFTIFYLVAVLSLFVLTIVIV